MPTAERLRRGKRRRTRSAHRLTPAETWLLTGELQRTGVNTWEEFALDRGHRRQRVRELLDHFGHMVPAGRMPLLEQMAASGRMKGSTLLERDVIAYWERHGVSLEDPHFDWRDHPPERWNDWYGDEFAVDGVGLPRCPIPGRWLQAWRQAHTPREDFQ